MKRKNYLIQDNITFDNVEKCYLDVKRNCKSESKLFGFAKSKNFNVARLYLDLYNDTYQMRKYHIFLIRENKYRIIMSESIDDKVVSHFLYSFVVYPTLNHLLIDQNVATRKDMGSKAAYNYFESYIRKIGINKNIYALKIDISKYFYNIDHNILKDKLRKHIKDAKALKYLFMLIDETSKPYVNAEIKALKEDEIQRILSLDITEKEKRNLITEVNRIPYYEKGKGISIGNVCSQPFAIFYMDEVDKYIKNELKCKGYVRYMDDLVILSEDKEFLKDAFKKITNKINYLGLKVNPKSNIYLINNSFTFLGNTYHIKDNKLINRTRSSTYKRVLKKLEDLRKIDFEKYYLSKISYKGLISSKLLHSLDDEIKYLEENYDVPIIKIYDFTSKRKIKTLLRNKCILIRENKVVYN